MGKSVVRENGEVREEEATTEDADATDGEEREAGPDLWLHKPWKVVKCEESVQILTSSRSRPDGVDIQREVGGGDIDIEDRLAAHRLLVVVNNLIFGSRL